MLYLFLISLPFVFSFDSSTCVFGYLCYVTILIVGVHHETCCIASIILRSLFFALSFLLYLNFFGEKSLIMVFSCEQHVLGSMANNGGTSFHEVRHQVHHTAASTIEVRSLWVKIVDLWYLKW